MLSPALRRYQPAALCLGVLALLALALAPAPAQTLGHGGSYLVGFRGRVDAGLVSAAGGQVTRTFHLIPALAARLPTQAAQQLARHPQVAYVEPDAPAYAYYSPGEYLPWGIERVGAPLAWAGLQGLLPNTAAGFKVALLDTGVDYTHPDLAACYAGGVDIVNGDGDPRDDNGHGTHCAGIIAAADDGPNQGGRNSGYCVVGVAPGARIVAVKVLGAQGSGSYSQVIAGLEWARDNGLKLVNLGLGGQFSSQALQAACDACWAAGMLLVAAAGNEGTAAVGYPARYRNVVAVGAVDSANNRAWFSNYGEAIAVCAPGVEVLAPLPTYPAHLTTVYTYQDTYDSLTGTSAAAAHVTGVLALTWSRDPRASNTVIRRRLAEITTDLGLPGKDAYFGSGLVNAGLLAR